MKKIISLGLVLLMILMTGCNYLMPESESEDEGVTYIDLSELVGEEEEVEEVVVEEEPEEVVEVSSVKEIPTVIVTEGKTVSFPNLKATDPDGDKIEYTFSEPMGKDGKWETEEGDAGEYTVTITASDGTSKVEQEVRVIVQQLNKPPVLEKIKDVVIKEGETLELSPKALDPEGEPLTITYSGWMNSNTKELNYKSAGEYVVRVTVSDGTKEVSQDVKITVEDVNRPPEFVSII
jgi:hypothetical protein